MFWRSLYPWVHKKMKGVLKLPQQNRMGTVTIPRLILSLAGPAIVAQLINILYNSR